MRSASSRRVRARALGLLALLWIAVSVGGGQGQRDALPLSVDEPSHRIGILEATGATRLERSSWTGGTYVTSAGESVRVNVSDSYPSPEAVGLRWAEFLASLLHASELELVSVYVVTPDELRLHCGPNALGCYGDDQLVFSGETVDGVRPEEVAAHEYGHHVAAHRANPPWRSLDWGPKRWASAANICARARENAVFPDGYPANYRLHPGEGFAEVYRVLNEARAGATVFGWPIVDLSFYPDAAALRAAEQDVVAAWTAPTTRMLRARFTASGKKIWETRIATPLDGGLTVSLRFPRGAFHELTVLDGDRRTVLAKGLWSGGAEKRATATVCGQRSIVVRLRRGGPPSTFALRVTHD